MRAPTEELDIESHAPRADTTADLLKLSLGALGVVYGDIGTSPLYTIRECFTGTHALRVTHDNVLGILSLIFWALMLVVVGKYLSYIMRADNHGEGGILALVALLRARGKGDTSRGMRLLMLLGLFGAALLYGDGMITPAISILGAVEGLEVATVALGHFVVPISVVILVVLFLVQRRGTAGVAAVFGPAMLVWFVSIGILGLRALWHQPAVLTAINPLYALRLLIEHGHGGFLVLGAVVLAITGGEALYADMGHFGRRPIRLAWYAVAMPALLANYFGQGALILERGTMVKNPFYALADGWLLYPMVVIATLAAVIASQALISGAFSLTREAVQLGYWPRVRIIHTSGEAAGQIFIPEINNLLMIACIALVIGFRASSGLAGAYGIAVTGTMSITSILFYKVARSHWGWSRLHAGTLLGLFLVVDLAFLTANLPKIAEGGWFPLLVGLAFFALMTTWRRGRQELNRTLSETTMPEAGFMQDLGDTKPHRVSGTAVFMTSLRDGIPPVLLHHFKHNKVLHEQVVLLSVESEDVPTVSGKERIEVRAIGHGFYRVIAHYGFMEVPNVPRVLRKCRPYGLKVEPATTSYYLGRETLLVTGPSRMARWRKLVFAFFSRNARSATSFFGLPPNRVVEMGAQIEL